MRIIENNENLQDCVSRLVSLSVTHALVWEQRYCWDRSALCFYSVALQIALAALTKEKTCHIFSEASLPQQLGDQATVHACKGLPDKGNGTCQRFWANLRLQTLKCRFAWGKTGMRARPRNQDENWRQFGISCNSSPWAWLRNTCVSKWCHGNASYSAIRPVWGLKGEPTGWEQGIQTQTRKHLGKTLANQPHLGSKSKAKQSKAALKPTVTYENSISAIRKFSCL